VGAAGKKGHLAAINGNLMSLPDDQQACIREELQKALSNRVEDIELRHAVRDETEKQLLRWVRPWKWVLMALVLANTGGLVAIAWRFFTLPGAALESATDYATERLDREIPRLVEQRVNTEVELLENDFEARLVPIVPLAAESLKAVHNQAAEARGRLIQVERDVAAAKSLVRAAQTIVPPGESLEGLVEKLKRASEAVQGLDGTSRDIFVDLPQLQEEIERFRGVPVGTVVAWFAGCREFGIPEHVTSLVDRGQVWMRCDGGVVTTEGSPLRGFRVPDLNGVSTDSAPPGWPTGWTRGVRLFLRGGIAAGNHESDALQGHRHNLVSGSGNESSVPIARDADPLLKTHRGSLANGAPRFELKSQVDLRVGGVISDRYNGSARIADETRPANVSVVWIIRVK
jgi:hypothetical protein